MKTKIIKSIISLKAGAHPICWALLGIGFLSEIITALAGCPIVGFGIAVSAITIAVIIAANNY